MLIEDVKKMIRCGESSRVQFKREFTSQKQIASELVAFANTKGGSIIFGVNDKTGSLAGLSYEQIQQISTELGNAATEHVRPNIFLTTETLEIDSQKILVATIDEGKNKPYKDLNGTIWVKQAGDKRKLTENSEILGLFQESKMFAPEKSAVQGTSLNDLEITYINDFFQKNYGRPKESFDKPLSKMLQSMGVLTSAGEVTQAGLLFFGKYPQTFLPCFKIKAVAFFGNDIGEVKYRDSRDIEGTIPWMYREAMAFLSANLLHEQKEKGFNSVGELEIPQIILEELLQNALVHLDLLKKASIRILVFLNRVEIISPGCLFDGLTIDDIVLGVSKQRNPLIASFCSKSLVYRGLGSGIIRSLREGFKIDFVNDENKKEFKVIVWKSDDKPTINLKTDDKPTTNSKNDSISDDKPTIKDVEKSIVELLNQEIELPTKAIATHIGLSSSQTKEYLYRLIDKGYLESLGENKNRRYRKKT